MSEEKKMTFEEASARIEQIVRLLEKGDEPLDKSLELFEEGAKLIKLSGAMLDEAEQLVTSLQKGIDTSSDDNSAVNTDGSKGKKSLDFNTDICETIFDD